MKVLILFFLYFCFTKVYFSQTIQKGFEALKVKNYNISEKVFRFNQKKYPSASSFGLAKLYLTNDYRNSDSAFRFILLAEQKWSLVDQKTREKFRKFNFDSVAIQNLKLDVSEIHFLRSEKNNTALDFQKFIDYHKWSPKCVLAVIKRDSLLFIDAKNRGSWTDISDFINSNPNSHLIVPAQNLMEDLQYFESTISANLSDYVLFIKNYPNNRNVSRAENEIYNKSIVSNSIEVYENFIRNFPKNPNIEKVWRKLYELYNLKFNYKKIKDFKLYYPDYPFLNDLNRDIAIFSEQYYPIIQNNKFGYMNEIGKMVINPIYDEASIFFGSIAIVSKNGKTGIINKRNDVVLEFLYDGISEFYGDVAIAYIGDNYGLIDFNGTLVTPLLYSDIIVLNNFQFGAKDENGFVIYSNNGTFIKNVICENLIPLNNGNYLISLENKIGLLDTYFDVKISPIYEDITSVFDTIYSYQLNTKKGLISLNGKLLTEAIYDDFSKYNPEENNLIAKKDNSIYYLNIDGSKFLPKTYEYFSNALSTAKFVNKHAIFFKQGKFGIMNNNGKQVLNQLFEGIGTYGKYISVKKSGKWCFMDTTGKIILKSEYSDIIPFRDIGYVIEKNNSFGFLDLELNIVLSPSFKTIKYFEGDYLIVSDGSNYGLFNLKGEEIIPLAYNRIESFGNNILSLFNDKGISYFMLSSSKFIQNQ